MKKLLFIALMIGGATVANAQSELTFRPFKFDISAGYASSISSGSNGGFLFSIEPKYALSDQLSLGMRVEMTIAVTGDENTGSVKGTGSYLATGDYYFNSNTVRPFAGFGLGIFRHASADIASAGEEIPVITKFGFAPRIGVEIAHFRAAVEYNFAGKAGEINKSYLGLKLGVLIGGGRIE